ncbi:DUF6386 family protein [Paenibacillus sp. MER 99-2]|uniref:DUF6386 family protein n=1 Tax=Paenibacillus sp. MER 99-2 TaxID=2939572 RepID=UPI0020403357|nr:DUF6386 family protein [Paenibacillus sp. MER 99-2]MCM3170843.1 DUF6386 family protein [Paenibacillus sp. MER 99-2]
MRQASFSFITDTSTMCIYDLGTLKHRLQDTVDWWSIPEDELAEVNAGHCLFINLGADGAYDVDWSLNASLSEGERTGEGQIYYLNVPTGKIFMGAAEDVTADELEPDEACEGVLLELEPGSYACIIWRESNRIHVTMEPSVKGSNHLEDLIRI